MPEEVVETPEESERGFGERLASVRKAVAALLATRAAIFREELAAIGGHTARAAAGLGLAGAFVFFALLVLTAFLCALFARLFGSLLIGFFAVFLLYTVVAAVSAVFGWKALARARALDLSRSREEFQKDWEAVRLALKKEEEKREDEEEAIADTRFSEEASRRREAEEEDLEARFRTGGE